MASGSLAIITPSLAGKNEVLYTAPAGKLVEGRIYITNQTSSEIKFRVGLSTGTASDFDVTQVDTRSVEFEGAFEMNMQGHFADIDGDGDIDLVFRFRIGDTVLRCEDTEGKLTGLLVDGTPFEGIDAVKMVSLGP